MLFLAHAVFFYTLSVSVDGVRWGAKEHTIYITNSLFNPQYLKINSKDTVVFRNKDTQPHWPASNIHSTHDIYSEFDPTKQIEPGEAWSFKFSKPGQWRYHDHLNASVSGVINVTAAGSGDEDNSLRGALLKQKENMVLGYAWLKSKIVEVYFNISPSAGEEYLVKSDIKYLIDSGKSSELAVLVNIYGPQKVTEQLSLQSQKSKFNCHTAAHEVGRISYKIFGGSELQSRITFCHSGYIHGVMSSIVQNTGGENIVDQINSICNSINTDFGKLSCIHGAGHGLMAYYDYDLLESISKCREFDRDFGFNSCLAGVFMENISTQFGESLNSHNSVWIDRNRIHYPCDQFDDDSQVQNVCYNIHPVWMAYVLKYDMSKVVSLCLEIPEGVSLNCMFGYGQVIGLINNYDPVNSAEYCKKIPEGNFDSRDNCVRGVLISLMDYWGKNLYDKGDKYCLNVPVINQESCYKYLQIRKEDLKI